MTQRRHRALVATCEKVVKALEEIAAEKSHDAENPQDDEEREKAEMRIRAAQWWLDFDIQSMSLRRRSRRCRKSLGKNMTVIKFLRKTKIARRQGSTTVPLSGGWTSTSKPVAEKTVKALEEIAGEKAHDAKIPQDDEEREKAEMRIRAAQWWLDFGITRKVTKRNCMTFPYGSKERGFSDQILEDTLRPFVKDGAADNPLLKMNERGQLDTSVPMMVLIPMAKPADIYASVAEKTVKALEEIAARKNHDDKTSQDDEEREKAEMRIRAAQWWLDFDIQSMSLRRQ